MSICVYLCIHTGLVLNMAKKPEYKARPEEFFYVHSPTFSLSLSLLLYLPLFLSFKLGKKLIMLMSSYNTQCETPKTPKEFQRDFFLSKNTHISLREPY